MTALRAIETSWEDLDFIGRGVTEMIRASGDPTMAECLLELKDRINKLKSHVIHTDAGKQPLTGTAEEPVPICSKPLE